MEKNGEKYIKGETINISIEKNTKERIVKLDGEVTTMTLNDIVLMYGKTIDDANGYIKNEKLYLDPAWRRGEK